MFARSFSTLSATASDAPMEKSPCSSTTCPKLCAHGRNDSERSFGPISRTSCMALTLFAMLPCERRTPLGLPVVPDV